MRQHGKHMILAGDFNVHSTSWLGSSRTTIAGEFLEEISATNCLVQHVTQPTRGPNTLDLVLSDFPGTVHTAVSSPIGRSDHCVVLSNFQEITPVLERPTSRKVWRYDQADWGRLRAHFRSFDWAAVVCDVPELACEQLTTVILDGMDTFIPSKTLTVRTTVPCWWTPECSTVVQAKIRVWKR